MGRHSHGAVPQSTHRGTATLPSSQSSKSGDHWAPKLFRISTGSACFFLPFFLSVILRFTFLGLGFSVLSRVR